MVRHMVRDRARRIHAQLNRPSAGHDAPGFRPGVFYALSLPRPAARALPETYRAPPSADRGPRSRRPGTRHPAPGTRPAGDARRPAQRRRDFPHIAPPNPARCAVRCPGTRFIAYFRRVRAVRMCEIEPRKKRPGAPGYRVNFHGSRRPARPAAARDRRDRGTRV